MFASCFPCTLIVGGWLFDYETRLKMFLWRLYANACQWCLTVLLSAAGAFWTYLDSCWVEFKVKGASRGTRFVTSPNLWLILCITNRRCCDVARYEQFRNRLVNLDDSLQEQVARTLTYAIVVEVLCCFFYSTFIFTTEILICPTRWRLLLSRKHSCMGRFRLIW